MRNWSKYDFWAVLVALAIFVAVALTAVLSVRSDTPDALPADTEATPAYPTLGHPDCKIDVFPTVYHLKYEFTEEDGKTFYEEIMDTGGYVYFTTDGNSVFFHDYSCDDTTSGAQLPDSLKVHHCIRFANGIAVQATRVWTGDGIAYENVAFVFRRDADASPYCRLVHYVRQGDTWACYYSLTPETVSR